ncbi:MAG: hypothetical protein RL095_2632 [Verrucomicrobiota bacterium]
MTPDQPQAPENPEEPAKRAPAASFLACFAIAFITQALFLPCLCAVGTAKMALAFAIDMLVLLRFAVGWHRREQGRWWMFYCALLLSSPLWIEALAMIFCHH